jgi:hypothetical protein
MLKKEQRKICRKCKVNKGTMKMSKTSSGYLYWCRDCNTKRLQKYRNKNRDKINEIARNCYQKHKKEQNARMALNQAVKRGDIERPHSCSKCGSTEQIEGHHEDYNKPLDVEWLCRPCHATLHRNLKNK